MKSRLIEIVRRLWLQSKLYRSYVRINRYLNKGVWIGLLIFLSLVVADTYDRELVSHPFWGGILLAIASISILKLLVSSRRVLLWYLDSLSALHDKGLISDAEYEELRKTSVTYFFKMHSVDFPNNESTKT